MLHPKERNVIRFIEQFRHDNNGKDPQIKDICGHYTIDLESIVIAIKELQIPGQDTFLNQVKYKLHPEVVKERVAQYSSYPHLFDLFLERDLRTALEIFNLSFDKSSIGTKIVSELIEDRKPFLMQLMSLDLYPEQRISVEFRDFHISNQINQGVLIELGFLDNAEFEDGLLKAYFIFFQLHKISQMAEGSEELVEEILKKNRSAEFSRGNIFLNGRIKPESIVFKINLTRLEELVCGFNVPTQLDRQALVDKVKEVAQESAIDVGIDFAASFFGPLAIVGKAGVAAFKIFTGVKGKSDAQQVAEKYEAYKNSGVSTVRHFYIYELRTLMSKFCKTNHLDPEMIPDAFYTNQYIKFIESYENKSMILEETLRKSLYDIPVADDRDTRIFEEVSLTMMNKSNKKEVIPT